MDDLQLADHLPQIEAMIARYVVARVELVASKEDIGGKLGQSNWSSTPGVVPLIQFPRCISGAEVADFLLALALRGIVTENQKLVQHADVSQALNTDSHAGATSGETACSWKRTSWEVRSGALSLRSFIRIRRASFSFHALRKTCRWSLLST